jgi:ABC-type branched-subunit amino acid transport system substrate-binding protein
MKLKKNEVFRGPSKLTRVACTMALVSGMATAATITGLSSTASASNAPIKIMVLGSIQSAALSEPGIVWGATAGVDALNAAGGLDGHQIKIITCNDQLEVNIAEQCARTAVKDKVVAAVGSLTIYGDSVVPILAKAGIPDIAPFPISASEEGNADSYPIQGGNLMEARGMAQIMAMNKVTGVNQIEVDSVAGVQGAGQVDAALSARGIQSLNTQYVAATVDDMSSAVFAAANNGAGGVITQLAPPQVVPTIEAESQANSGQIYAFTTTILTPAELQQAGAAANGVWAAGSFPATSDTSIPAIAAYTAAMNKYENGDALDDFSLNSWCGIQFLKLMAPSLKGKAITPASLKVALGKIKDKKFLWIKSFSTTPNKTPGNARIFNTTVFIYKVVNGAYVQQAEVALNS